MRHGRKRKKGCRTPARRNEGCAWAASGQKSPRRRGTDARNERAADEEEPQGKKTEEKYDPAYSDRGGAYHSCGRDRGGLVQVRFIE